MRSAAAARFARAFGSSAWAPPPNSPPNTRRASPGAAASPASLEDGSPDAATTQSAMACDAAAMSECSSRANGDGAPATAPEGC